MNSREPIEGKHYRMHTQKVSQDRIILIKYNKSSSYIIGDNPSLNGYSEKGRKGVSKSNCILCKRTGHYNCMDYIQPPLIDWNANISTKRALTIFKYKQQKKKRLTEKCG